MSMPAYQDKARIRVCPNGHECGNKAADCPQCRTHKTCTRCRERLPLDAYSRTTRNADGRRSMCRTCEAARREELTQRLPGDWPQTRPEPPPEPPEIDEEYQRLIDAARHPMFSEERSLYSREAMTAVLDAHLEPIPTRQLGVAALVVNAAGSQYGSRRVEDRLAAKLQHRTV
jgi:hypothetical protein